MVGHVPLDQTIPKMNKGERSIWHRNWLLKRRICSCCMRSILLLIPLSRLVLWSLETHENSLVQAEDNANEMVFNLCLKIDSIKDVTWWPLGVKIASKRLQDTKQRWRASDGLVPEAQWLGWRREYLHCVKALIELWWAMFCGGSSYCWIIWNMSKDERCSLDYIV